MAITTIAELNIQAAVAPAAATEIVVTGVAVLITADGLLQDEHIHIWRLGGSAAFGLMTDSRGPVVLTKNPNTLVLYGPQTYRLSKDITSGTPIVGYQ